MVKCDICGKECKNNQGLAAHRRIKHSTNESLSPLSPSDVPPLVTRDAQAITETLERHQEILGAIGIVLVGQEESADVIDGGVAKLMASIEESSQRAEKGQHGMSFLLHRSKRRW